MGMVHANWNTNSCEQICYDNIIFSATDFLKGSKRIMRDIE